MSPEPDMGPELVPGHPRTSPWHIISFPLSGFPSFLEIGEESQSDSQLHPGKAWGWGVGVGCGGWVHAKSPTSNPEQAGGSWSEPFSVN